MAFLLRFLLIVALCLTPALRVAAQDKPALRVHVVGSDFILPAKFVRLQAMAEAEGVALHGASLSALDDHPDWARADFILLDTPRPSDVEAVRVGIGDRLETGDRPWVRIGGGAPAFGNLPPEAARRGLEPGSEHSRLYGAAAFGSPLGRGGARHAGRLLPA